MTAVLYHKQNMIELTCGDDCDFLRLEIKIDGETVCHHIDNKKIFIPCDLPFGLHYLEVELLQGNKFSCDRVLIDDENIRMMLYLSWVIDRHSRHHQPGTTLWEANMKWKLPFGNPVSWWYGLVYSKIPNNNFGSDLGEKFDILWPQSIHLDANYPALLKSFFRHNFDFYCAPKGTGAPPWKPINIKLDDQLVSAAVIEIANNQEWIKKNQRFYSQRAANAEDFPELNQSNIWTGVSLIDNQGKWLHTDHLPEIYSLIESLHINNLSGGVLGILPPKSFLVPHIDDCAEERNLIGPYNMYLPLQWDHGNYFKFYSGGLIPDGPCLTNISQYVHAVVNTSERPRYILTFRFDIQKNQQILVD